MVLKRFVATAVTYNTDINFKSWLGRGHCSSAFFIDVFVRVNATLDLSELMQQGCCTVLEKLYAFSQSKCTKNTIAQFSKLYYNMLCNTFFKNTG